MQQPVQQQQTHQSSQPVLAPIALQPEVSAFIVPSQNNAKEDPAAITQLTPQTTPSNQLNSDQNRQSPSRRQSTPMSISSADISPLGSQQQPPKLTLNTLDSISEEEDNPLMNPDKALSSSKQAGEISTNTGARVNVAIDQPEFSSAVDNALLQPTAEQTSNSKADNQESFDNLEISAAGPSSSMPTAEARSRSKIRSNKRNKSAALPGGGSPNCLPQ